MKANTFTTTQKNSSTGLIKRVRNYVLAYAKKCRNSYLHMLSI